MARGTRKAIDWLSSADCLLFVFLQKQNQTKEQVESCVVLRFSGLVHCQSIDDTGGELLLRAHFVQEWMHHQLPHYMHV